MYVVGQDKVAGRRQVVPGRSVDELLVIRDGLQPGDRVIINGVQKVFFDGMPVQPNRVAMQQQIPSRQPVHASEVVTSHP